MYQLGNLILSAVWFGLAYWHRHDLQGTVFAIFYLACCLNYRKQ